MTQPPPKPPHSSAERITSEGPHGEWSSVGEFVTSTSADALWAVAREPESWPAWWHELRMVRLRGPLAADVRGVVRLVGLPPLPLRIVAATPGERLALQVSCASVLIDLDLAFAQRDGATRIVERVTTCGVGATLVGRHMCRRRGDRFALSMTRLVSLAVVAQHHAEIHRGSAAARHAA